MSTRAPQAAAAPRAPPALRAFEPLVFARRRLVAAVLLALTAIFAAVAACSLPDAGRDRWLPGAHPYVQADRQYRAQFGGAAQVQLLLLHRQGDIYDAGFLRRLRQATETVGALPDVDPAQLHSLFAPGLDFVEAVEGGIYAGPVLPSDYPAQGDPAPAVLARLRSNVARAGLVGRLVSVDQRGAAVLAGLRPAGGDAAAADLPGTVQQIVAQVHARLSSPERWVFRAAQDLVAGRDFGLPGALRARAGTLVFHRGDTVAVRYDGATAWTRWSWRLAVPVRVQFADGSATPVRMPARLLAATGEANPDYAPDIEVHLSGELGRAAGLPRAAAEAGGFVALLLALAGAALWLCLGSIRLALLPVAAALAALAWQLGLSRLAAGSGGHGGLDPAALAPACLVLAVSLTQGALLAAAWRRAIGLADCCSFDAALSAWRAVAPCTLAAVAGAALCFGTLAAAPVPALRTMALDGVLGMPGALAANLVLLPIWLSGLGERHARPAPWRALAPLWSLPAQVARPPLAVCALALCGAVLGGALWQGQRAAADEAAAGAPELRAQAAYNRDVRIVAAALPLAAAPVEVIARTGADGCTRREVMDQVDGLAQELDDTAGVLAIRALPAQARLVNAAINEGSPKFRVLPRGREALAHAVQPFTPASGLLNEDCSAMPVWVFPADRSGATVARILRAAAAFDAANARAFYAGHPGANAASCNGSPQAPRQCPVQFVIAGGGALIAAADATAAAWHCRLLLLACLAAAVCAGLAARSAGGAVAAALPPILAAALAYALPAVRGAGLSVQSLPLAALAAAVALGPALHAQAAWKRQRAPAGGAVAACRGFLDDSGIALLLAGLALGAGAAAWLFSAVPAQREFGVLLALSAGVGALAGLLAVPAALSLAASAPRPALPADHSIGL